MAPPAEAASRTWQDFGDHVNWTSPVNWSPIGAPTGSDNLTIGSHSNAVGDQTTIDQDFSVNELLISAGASADTAGNALVVANLLYVTDADSAFVASQHAAGVLNTVLSADTLTIANGGIYRMMNGRTAVSGNFVIGADSALRGFGSMSAGIGINNNGTVTASDNGVLTLQAAGNSHIDLDGSNETGTIEAMAGSLRVFTGLTDEFNGTMTIGGDRRVTLDGGGTIGPGGVVNLQGGTVFPAKMGPLVTGASNTLVKGTINVSQFGNLNSVNLLSGASVSMPNHVDRLGLSGMVTIESGVTFSGNGELAGATQSDVMLADGAQVAVKYTSAGITHLGSAPGEIGSAEVLSYRPTFLGTLQIDIGSGGNDVLLTSLTTNLMNSNLDVHLADGFMPSGGAAFNIVSSLGTPIVGQFSTTANHLPALSNGLSWQIDYSDPDNVFLRVLSPYSADFDNDGDVDGHDFLVWQRGDSPNGTGSGDLTLWQSEYGNSLPLTATANAVPESGTLLLLLCGTLLTSRGRFRRQGSFC